MSEEVISVISLYLRQLKPRCRGSDRALAAAMLSNPRLRHFHRSPATGRLYDYLQHPESFRRISREIKHDSTFAARTLRRLYSSPILGKRNRPLAGRLHGNELTASSRRHLAFLEHDFRLRLVMSLFTRNNEHRQHHENRQRPLRYILCIQLINLFFRFHSEEQRTWLGTVLRRYGCSQVRWCSFCSNHWRQVKCVMI